VTHDPDPAVVAWSIAIAGHRNAFPRPTRRHWWRDLVTDTYRAARDARDHLRESGHHVDTAGAAHSQVAAYQLSDQEFDQAHPPVTFRQVLEDLSSGRVAPENRWAAW
jgi:hypothetical protein